MSLDSPHMVNFMVPLDSPLDLLLVANSNHMTVSFCLAIITAWKVVSYALSMITDPKFQTPQNPPLIRWSNFFSKLNGSMSGSDGKLAPTQIEFDWFKLFWGILLMDGHTHIHIHKCKVRKPVQFWNPALLIIMATQVCIGMYSHNDETLLSSDYPTTYIVIIANAQYMLYYHILKDFSNVKLCSSTLRSSVLFMWISGYYPAPTFHVLACEFSCEHDSCLNPRHSQWTAHCTGVLYL